MVSRIVSSLVFAFAVPAVAAAPPCKERVKQLDAIADTREAEAREGVFELAYPGRSPLAERLADRPDWQTRGVRLIVNDGPLLDDDAAMLRDELLVAKDTKLEFCVQLNAPFESVASKDADQASVAKVVKEIAPMLAVDRATIVGSHFSEDKWKCKDLKSLGNALANVDPLDRLAIAARSVSESLVACKCPTPDTERAFALVTLLADTWRDKRRCAPVTVAKPGSKALVLKGTWRDVLTQLEAGAAVVPAPAPPKSK